MIQRLNRQTDVILIVEKPLMENFGIFGQDHNFDLSEKTKQYRNERHDFSRAFERCLFSLNLR